MMEVKIIQWTLYQNLHGKYPQKIVALEKENGGLSDARNYGISHAKGEYVAFIDSDDYVELTMYEDMYNLAKKEECDMVECDFYWEYPNKVREDIGATYHTKKEMLEKIRVMACNKLIKRDVIEKAQIQFPKGYRYEDVEFTYKLILYIEKASSIRKPYMHYVQRDASISNLQNERTKEIFNVLDHVIEYYKQNGFFEMYEEQLEYLYARYLLCSSLLRMVKIPDKGIRKQLLKQTWINLNEKFPKWKQNKILKEGKNKKNIYMRTVNKFTFPIYCKIFSLK